MTEKEMTVNDKALRLVESWSKRQLVKYIIMAASHARLEYWAREYDQTNGGK